LRVTHIMVYNIVKEDNIMHHTKDKGDLGVLKAQVDLHQQGWMVLVPHTEHAPFDLVGYKNGRFVRVQVKFRSLKDETIYVSLHSVWNDKNGTHCKPMDKSQVDIVCIYCAETDNCYYVDPSTINGSVRLRVGATKNNQQAGIRLANDYRKIP